MNDDLKKEKIKSLKRTIKYLTGIIEVARAEIAEKNPEYADLILSEALNDKRFEYN